MLGSLVLIAELLVSPDATAGPVQRPRLVG